MLGGEEELTLPYWVVREGSLEGDRQERADLKEVKNSALGGRGTGSARVLRSLVV